MVRISVPVSALPVTGLMFDVSLAHVFFAVFRRTLYHNR